MLPHLGVLGALACGDEVKPAGTLKHWVSCDLLALDGDMMSLILHRFVRQEAEAAFYSSQRAVRHVANAVLVFNLSISDHIRRRPVLVASKVPEELPIQCLDRLFPTSRCCVADVHANAIRLLLNH